MLVTAARAWLPIKAALSRAIAWWSPRAPLPQFATPESLAGHMRARLVYRADPLGGAADYYTHPEHVQWQLEGGVSQLARDCDDFATYAYLALSRMPGVRPRMVTLVDKAIRMSHVVCAFSDGARFGVIDTNGLHCWGPDAVAELIQDEQDEDALLISRFAGLYRCRYLAAITTPYPFR